ncbi:glycosyltransferase 25 family member-like [Convolutriloba macropyga]|uniref:glycosyltransferase 25 family member-like n=1 Tax=Convolutriloba macropyga TaxID=536237 RepID=UPI003F525E74
MIFALAWMIFFSACQCSEINFGITFINLDRREDRKIWTKTELLRVFPDVHIKRLSAVDAKGLNQTELKERHIGSMQGYEDPYEKRPLKLGEVACFLSHYNVWTDIIEKESPLTLIVEDDVRFDPHKEDLFRELLNQAVTEFVDRDGDLLYLGRKALADDIECDGCQHLVKPGYSYWTVAYMLTLRGAQKLVNTEILSRLIPVDEYIPLMYNQNPTFDPWDLEELGDKANEVLLDAYSTRILLAGPSWQPSDGDPYYSDTNDSALADL